VLNSPKKALGGEWSRPFCSGPWVRSLKGPNLWSYGDQKGNSPDDQHVMQTRFSILRRWCGHMHV